MTLCSATLFYATLFYATLVFVLLMSVPAVKVFLKVLKLNDCYQMLLLPY